MIPSCPKTLSTKGKPIKPQFENTIANCKIFFFLSSVFDKRILANTGVTINIANPYIKDFIKLLNIEELNVMLKEQITNKGIHISSNKLDSPFVKASLIIFLFLP
ncbi:hypothetical protein CPJCM30710_21070 [Clostridium polyendosporum]|uniref:Uncharacterized protein n=1 Tax=Clostridium polyendosporum TaxID=69208 RepID=A0A919S189_9CLOT|nr:hypothetical protein CPJCM30710_21070 [Clostridium polyendosporum]